MAPTCEKENSMYKGPEVELRPSVYSHMEEVGSWSGVIKGDNGRRG